MAMRATTGFPASGCSRPAWVCSGLPAIGAGTNGAYLFNAGYWGPHVGFYGGINYGFGFGGVGFYGGEWRGGHFAYNTAYSHVNTTEIHNTYINRTTINNTTISHTSFNGGGRWHTGPSYRAGTILLT